MTSSNCVVAVLTLARMIDFAIRLHPAERLIFFRVSLQMSSTSFWVKFINSPPSAVIPSKYDLEKEERLFKEFYSVNIFAMYD